MERHLEWAGTPSSAIGGSHELTNRGARRHAFQIQRSTQMDSQKKSFGKSNAENEGIVEQLRNFI